MKKFLLFLISAVALTAIGSCDRAGDLGSVTVDPAALIFEASGNSAQYVMVTADNTTWTASVDPSVASWLHITPTGFSIKVTVDNNEGSGARFGVITVTPSNGDPKLITVTQAAPDIVFNNVRCIYRGDSYGTGIGNFNLLFDNIDEGYSGYGLYLVSFSDLNDTDPVWTPGTYPVNDSEDIYTVLSQNSGNASGLITFVNDEATEVYFVISGTVEAALDGGGIYTVNMALTIRNSDTLEESTLTMYYKGTIPVDNWIIN